MDAIFSIIVIVVLVGGGLYLLNMAPINETWKKIGTALVIISGILWALRVLRGFL